MKTFKPGELVVYFKNKISSKYHNGFLGTVIKDAGTRVLLCFELDGQKIQKLVSKKSVVLHDETG